MVRRPPCAALLDAVTTSPACLRRGASRRAGGGPNRSNLFGVPRTAPRATFSPSGVPRLLRRVEFLYTIAASRWRPLRFPRHGSRVGGFHAPTCSSWRGGRRRKDLPVLTFAPAGREMRHRWPSSPGNVGGATVNAWCAISQIDAQRLRLGTTRGRVPPSPTPSPTSPNCPLH
jgi:hypothetical protein